MNLRKGELLRVNRISGEYINSLPLIHFQGNVVMVTTPEEADSILNLLMNETCVGFDTESKPSFTKGTSYPVSLIQFATHEAAYLIQLKKTGFSDRLVEFLENEKIQKIGVGVKNDLAKLQELRFFNPMGFIDLSKLASEKGIIQVGLRGLTARYIGVRLTKSAQKTNWAQPVLSPKQQIYAALDAWICLQIYPHLLADTTDYRQFDEEENQNEAPQQPNFFKKSMPLQGGRYNA